MNIKWFKNNTYPLNDKVVILTGATGGFGINLANNLLKLNCKLIFCYRNKELLEKFKSENKHTNIDYVELDLSSLSNVDSFVNYIYSNYSDGIDYLINLAGVYNLSHKLTSDGHDLMFMVNHLASYYLVKRLLPLLNKKNDARVVSVNSIAYKITKIPCIDKELQNCENLMKVYGLSKRYLTFCSVYNKFNLNKEYPNVKFILAHPGVSATNLFKKKDGSKNNNLANIMRLLFPSPKQASLNILYAMFVKDDAFDFTMVGPRGLFHIWGRPKLYRQKLTTAIIAEIETAHFETEEMLKGK